MPLIILSFWYLIGVYAKNCRYVLAVAVIAAAYCIVQLPFAIHYATKQKRMIGNGFLREFDFYGDKVTI